MTSQAAIESADLSDKTSVAAHYFGLVQQAFLHAERAAGEPIIRCYAIAGQVIRLCFAGSGLESTITPALEHLAIEPERPP